MKKVSEKGVAEKGTGNVYADLGFKNPGEMKAKACLVSEISRIIKARKLTQVEASALMEINQPKVSALLKGQFEGYSQERLVGFLNKLGRDVEIVIKPSKRRMGRGRLSVVLGPSVRSHAR